VIGLDTNVLVRYIVQDEPAQARSATQLIERVLTPEHPGFVNCVVMCELVWVLESAYGFARAQIIPVLRQLLATVEIRIESADRVSLALRSYESCSADFADHLVGILNQDRGCETTYTFDRKAGRLASHRLVELG
jgi:predicted nucleic-acid-binding protein